MTQRRGWTVLAILGLAAGASAQAITIDIANPTIHPGQTTSITLQASYPDGDYAIAGVATEIVVNVLHGGTNGLALIPPMDGPGTSPGAVGPDGGITGILAGQLNFPAAMIYADPHQNIAFHTFDFTWDGDTTGIYVLDIETRTTRFDVYVDRDSARSESRLDGLTEGRAVISVPAPAGATVLGLGALTLGRRRR